MRTTYETTEDRRKMRLFADDIAEAWEIHPLIKAPYDRFDIDFVDNSGEVIVRTEVKHRDCNHDTYDTYMISRSKVINAIAGTLCNRDIIYVIAVRYRDKDVYIQVDSDLPVDFGYGGRFDRQDIYDFEKVAYIPIGEFHRIHRQSPIVYDPIIRSAHAMAI
tara:strand:+ start:118 stop:603 length:486 start_codon:yes stop_codon:yes gene_type:complete